MKTLRFAFIGCGKIASFHADVIEHLGHAIDIVVARKNSVNIGRFAKRYGVKEKIYGVEAFLEYLNKSKNAVDCILVCTPWDVTEGILKKLLPLNIPIMAEKPAVLSADGLEILKKHNIENLFIAYNRRFYDFVPYLREMIQKKPVLCVDILSAEPFDMIVKRYGYGIKDYMLYYYTSHAIDLMYYLFGDLKVKDIFGVSHGEKRFWVCTLNSKRKDYPLHMKIFMDCPQNSCIKIFFEKEVACLKPFEKMILYDALEMKECEDRRIYVPRIKQQFETDTKFKAGFLNQMQYFINNFVYKRNRSTEHAELLEKVTLLCELINDAKEALK